MKPGSVAIALACATLFLGGCSSTPTSIAVETQKGTPDGFDSTSNLLNGEPGAAWLRGREGFAIVTYGSSACPPVPVKLELVDDANLSVTYVRSPNSPCGAELEATTSRFDAPKGLVEAGPVTLTVVYDFDQDYEYALTLD